TSSTASTKVSNSGELTLGPATAGGSYVLRQTHTGGRFDSAKITLNGSITVSGGSSSIQIDVERQHPDHSTGIAVGVAGVVLTAVSVDLNIHGEGSIGSASTPVRTATANLTVKAGSGVFLRNTGSVVVTDSFAGIPTSPKIFFELTT